LTMGNFVHVESIDSLKALKVSLWKFQEAANVALGDAESEMHRMLVWLETEQQTYWQGQIRKRTEAVARAKDAVRQKKLFKNAAGSTPSAVEEEKALAIAVRRLEEAEQKLVNVNKSTRRLHKEIQIYKGAVQRFATTVQSDIPVAASRLDNMIATLEAYTALGPETAAVSASTAPSSFDSGL